MADTENSAAVTMQKFNRVLFPTDFSPQCVDAVPYVDRLARKFGSEVILLNVIDTDSHFESDLNAGHPQDSPSNGQMQQQRDAALAEIEQRAFSGLPVHRVVVSGEPADCIVKYAQDPGADLILMPTHGRGRFRTLLLGSVTSKVLHDAQCPVWTTAHSELLAHESYGEIRTVLCGLDQTAESVPVIQTVAELTKRLGAELRLIHAIRSDNLQPDGRANNMPFQRFLLDVATERMEDLLRESQTDCEISIEFGAVPSVLKQAVLNFNAQLLVIGRGHIAKPLGRLRTHVAAIIRDSPCPVLSI